MRRCTTALVFALLAASTTLSQVNVRQDGTGDFTTISAALAFAFPGTTIEITDNGTYVEDLSIAAPGIVIRAAQHRFPVLKPATTTAGSTHVAIGNFLPGIELIGLTFDGAGSDGDGVDFATTSLGGRVTNCTFRDYRGVGAHALITGTDTTDFEVRGCIFANNVRSITIGGGFGPIFAHNCVVYAQASTLITVDWGIKGTSVPSWFGIRHCTIDTDFTGPGVDLSVNNIAPAPPGGGSIPGLPLPCTELGTVHMANSICVNGNPSVILSGQECSLQNNCLDGLPAGVTSLPANNGFGDPQFVDRANADFDLAVTSPCRNAGADAYLLEVEDDIEGTCRPISAAVDIGAYEATGATCALDWEWQDPNLLLFLTSPPGLFNGKFAHGGSSLTSCPGLLIPTGRLPLAIDPFLALSQSPAGAPLYAGVNGFINASGDHTGTLFIPAAVQTAVSGLTFYTAFVVLDAGPGFNFLGHSTAVEFSIP